MKIIRLHKLAAFLLPLALLGACGTEDKQKEDVFELTPEVIEIDAAGGQENISIVCSEDWAVSTDKSWAKPLVVSGKASTEKTVIPLNIAANSTGAERTATVSVKTMSMKTMKVSVKQSGSSSASSDRGIKTVADLLEFASAVNEGGSISKFMVDGEVVLLSDIDLSSVSEWTPIGSADSPYSGTFNGKGFCISGISWSYDVSKTTDNGFFGYAKNAVIKNTVFGKDGDCINVKGTNSSAVTASPVCGYAVSTLFTGITNNVDLNLSGDSVNGKYFAMAGICGYVNDGCVIGGATVSLRCVNNGDITTGRVSNTGNGATGVQTGGLCGYVTCSSLQPKIINCLNYGHIACPSGRGGGIAASLEKGEMTNCVNYGLIEDDIVGQYSGSTTAYAYKRMGGLSGNTGTSATISACENRGNVFSHIGCRAAGFVSHSTGTVSSCRNYGVILSDSVADGHGPAWGCANNPNKDTFLNNEGYGHVGGYTQYKDKPETAPDDMFTNAVLTPAEMFDTESTKVDWTKDSYYDWKVDQTRQLCSGCTYTRYICANVPRRVCVLEIDLTSAEVDLTTAYSDDIVPNPNANKNVNNGPCVRETLSQICARKRKEGQNIVAGINTGFFDSTNGISRAPHVEEGEPVYVNAPSVRKALSNHDWAFTTFTDGTASCGKKSFNGSTYGRAGVFSIGGKEFDYFSVNDTILRHVSTAYTANLYTYRYVKTPHPTELPSVTNDLAKNAFYLVCRFTSGTMKVNQGYASATVTAIKDGRVSTLSEAPYVTGRDEFVLSLSGATADAVSGLTSVGTNLQIRADMAIDGITKPIYTQNGTMFQFMVNGADASQTPPSTHTNITTYDPVTYAAVSQDGKKVWLVEVDGRQPWFSMGLKSYEMYRIAKKLGAWNMTRFDGGGSACMWVYDASSGNGALVSSPSDTKGERSDLNYILIRKK